MSIRVKLMITYAVLVLISAVVIITSGIRIFSGIMGEVTENMLEDTNMESIVTEIVDVLVEVRHAEKYEPEVLSEETFINDLRNKMTFYEGGIVVEYQGKLIESENLDFSDSFYQQLRSSHFDTEHDNTITENNRDYFFIDYPFEVKDNTIIYYFIIDVTNLRNVKANAGKRGVQTAVVILLIVMLPVLWIITNDIIQPIKQLSKGVDHIQNGELDFELRSKKKNEIGLVVKSFDVMRRKLKSSIERQIKFENNRKELISSISHDLKTPITSIKGHVEGIKDGVANTPEKLDKYLNVIYQKSQDMDQLIDDLFLFSKLDLNKLPFEKKSIPMNEFVSEIVQEMRFDFNQDNEIIQFNSNLPQNTFVSIDPIQMKRVLVNIMQNSMKYMDKEEKKVEITLNDLEDHVQIIIADNGQGIDEEHLEYIFDRFYRVDESRNPETGGTGLGLAISKQIVEQHGGIIKVYSKYLEGTKMVIELSKEVSND